jgi:Ni,Fe-hydrogenase I large subunit
MNTPVAVPDQPVEILRTLHSFDPCMACATHVMSEDGAELSTVKVVDRLFNVDRQAPRRLPIQR